MGNLQAAEDDLAEALDQQHHTVTFLQLGKVFTLQKEYAKAVALYQAALKYNFFLILLFFFNTVFLPL